jgi:hypothetical protein
MSTAPSGDAMTVRFHRDAEAAALKRQKVPRPVAWRIHRDDVAQFTAEGKHCQARIGNRLCRDPIAIVTWRRWRSAAAGRVLLTERFVCVRHGREFAERHGIEIEPSPPERSLR